MPRALLQGRKCGPTRGTLFVNRLNGGDGMQCLICSKTVEYCELCFWEEVICPACESLIMETSVASPEYDQLVRGVRLLWQKQLLDHSHRLRESEHI